MEVLKELVTLGLATEGNFYFGISGLELQSKFYFPHTYLSIFLN